MNRTSGVSKVFLNHLVMTTSSPADNSEPEFSFVSKDLSFTESKHSPRDCDFDLALTYSYIQCTHKGDKFPSELQTQD